MPTVRTLCPGCGAVVLGRGRCPSCRSTQRQQDDARRRQDPQQAEVDRMRRGAAYQKFRRWYCSRWPHCADPFQEHGQRLRAGEDLHHVRQLASHPEDLLDQGWCALLCRACHARISAMERSGQPTQHLFEKHLERVRAES